MSAERDARIAGATEIDRRSWLRRAVRGRGRVRLCDWGLRAQESRPASPDLSPEQQASQELERAQARVRAVTRRPS